MSGRKGFSLIELLVVLAIISILGAISVPIVRSFSRDDMRNGARTVYTMLRAARMYAMSYNVETAVVYELDDQFLSGSPMEDSLRNIPVRCIRAAQVMYRLPDEFGLMPSHELALAVNPAYLDVNTEVIPWQGTFVPAPITAGQKVEFAQGYSLLLEKPTPEYNPNGPPQRVYDADNPAVNLVSRPKTIHGSGLYLSLYHPVLDKGIRQLGMTPVYVYTGTINFEDQDELVDEKAAEILRARMEPITSISLSSEEPLGLGVHPRMAHVFEPRGNLKVAGEAERFTILFGPSPDTFPAERIWFVGDEPDALRILNWLDSSAPSLSDGGGNLIGIPIEIQRATGRTRLGS